MGAADKPRLSVSIPSPSHGLQADSVPSTSRPSSPSKQRIPPSPSAGHTLRPQSATRTALSVKSPTAQPYRSRSPVQRSRSQRIRDGQDAGGGAGDDGPDTHELRSQLDAERRKVAMLESELRLAYQVSQQAEVAHQAELASMDADRKRLMAERRHLLSKLTDIELVEDSVKELYVQVKDRIAEDGIPTPEQLLAEKASLADEHVLVVLGALHAQIKALWAFKVEAERDLVAGRAARDAQDESKLASMRAALRTLEAEVRLAHQETAAAKMRAEVAEELTATVQAEANQTANVMAAQHAELLKSLRQVTSEAHAARRQAGVALEEGKKRDQLVLTNRQLESARHFDRVAQDKELRRLQAAHEVQLSAMHRELHRLSDLMATNAMQAEQLDKALQANKHLKQNAQPGRVRELEHRLKTLESQLAASERRRQDLEEGRILTQQAHTAGAAGARVSNPASLGALACAQDAASEAGGSVSSRRSVVGRSTSLAARSAAIMAAARSASARERRDKQQVNEGDDPVYGVIANVNGMYREGQAALRTVKRDLADAGTSRIEKGVRPGLGAGPYMAQEMHATRNLEAMRMPQKSKLGAAGYGGGL